MTVLPGPFNHVRLNVAPLFLSRVYEEELTR